MECSAPRAGVRGSPCPTSQALCAEPVPRRGPQRATARPARACRALDGSAAPCAPRAGAAGGRGHQGAAGQPGRARRGHHHADGLGRAGRARVAGGGHRGRRRTCLPPLGRPGQAADHRDQVGRRLARARPARPRLRDAGRAGARRRAAAAPGGSVARRAPAAPCAQQGWAGGAQEAGALLLGPAARARSWRGSSESCCA